MLQTDWTKRQGLDRAAAGYKVENVDNLLQGLICSNDF